MLRSLQSLQLYATEATNGEVGRITDFSSDGLGAQRALINCPEIRRPI